MRRKGFMLNELLILIAVVAVFALLLFPIFAKGREKARQSYCLSNLKQIILAELMYASDWDNRLPQYYRLDDSKGLSIFEELYPYVKYTSTFVCPSDSKKPGPRANLKLQDGSKLKPSYGFRAESSGLRYEYIQDTWTCPMVLDLGGPLELWSAQRSPQPKNHVQPIFDKQSNVIGLPIQHNKGINIAFADGHCKWWATNTLCSGFGKKHELGSTQIAPMRQAPAKKIQQPAIVEDDAAIITLSAPLPTHRRFILVYEGVVQYSGVSK